MATSKSKPPSSSSAATSRLAWQQWHASLSPISSCLTSVPAALLSIEQLLLRSGAGTADRSGPGLTMPSKLGQDPWWQEQSSVKTSRLPHRPKGAFLERIGTTLSKSQDRDRENRSHRIPSKAGKGRQEMSPVPKGRGPAHLWCLAMPVSA